MCMVDIMIGFFFFLNKPLSYFFFESKQKEKVQDIIYKGFKKLAPNVKHTVVVNVGMRINHSTFNSIIGKDKHKLCKND